MCRCPRGGTPGPSRETATCGSILSAHVVATGVTLSDASRNDLTISELADRVGMSVRNIRAHQSRGLLPPPERRGRVACYGPEHERILLRVKELQAGGYNLAAISALLSERGSEFRPLQRLVLAPLLEQDEVELTWPEVTRMFRQTPDPDRQRRAAEARLVDVTDDGRVRVPSRQLLEGARALVEMGMPFDEIFEMQLAVTRVTRDAARDFVEMCLRCALEPFGDEPVPAERWVEVRERFEQLRRQMASVLAATFTLNVRRATEAILSEQLPEPGAPAASGPGDSG